uniref:2-hydroxyacyl-CoA lyase n=1 Tax=Polytomella parva TaxID=51329 RepID=A0A7S0UUS4_9CHLO
MSRTLVTFFDILEGLPDNLAIQVSGAKGVSRRQLQLAIIEASNILEEIGVKPGDVVSIAITNTIEFIVAFLAVTYARAIAAPLNPSYTEEEFHFYMEDSRSGLLLSPDDGNKKAEAAAAALRLPIFRLRLDVPGSDPVPVLTPLGQESVGRPRVLRTPRPQPSDVALFLHTSGTTSRPKGVPLTHANLVASLSNIVATYQLSPTDRSYLVMPLFHVHGLMAGLLAPLAGGGAAILPKEGRFSAAVFWADAAAYAATFYTAVPTIHQILLARASKDYPASAPPPPLRFIRSCSSSLAPATLEALEAAFKVPVLEAYAMTEASHQMTSNPLPAFGPHKAGSVGRPQGSVQLTVLDPTTNQPVPQGAIGEVCIRGPNVTAGYLNNPKANEEAYAGGWFHTGDQGRLDEEGFLFLTGRIKELINRGGEKISPLEVDGVLLSHPDVAEAVSFGAPDDKYGEAVAAAIVLKPGSVAAQQVVAGGGKNKEVEAAIKKHAALHLSGFKVPAQIFFTDVLPKTATGKIQRRHMVTHFITNKAVAAGVVAPATSTLATSIPTPPTPTPPPATATTASEGVEDGHGVIAKTLVAAGIAFVYGVVGIPVTPLASAVQAVGIRYIGFRNEQAAGYAAAAAGYLAGNQPAVLLTVSGPGAVHGIAGASHATINGWPLLMISGSAPTSELGKGAFQELDQVEALKPHVKFAIRAKSVDDIPTVIAAAIRAATSGRPGAAYVDIPSDVLGADGRAVLKTLDSKAIAAAAAKDKGPSIAEADVAAAAALLQSSERPLFVAGKGAAISISETQVLDLASSIDAPVLGTNMGRGVLPDGHALNVNAARSQALKNADVALIIGARLNWQLHFGESPRWAPDVKFILVDPAPDAVDVAKAALVLRGDAKVILAEIADKIRATPSTSPAPAIAARKAWISQLQARSTAARASLAKKLSSSSSSPAPLDYYASYAVISRVLDSVTPEPVIISEGANTMDMARLLVPARAPRTRLDAGTWGTMGIGLGSAIAAATIQDPKSSKRRVAVALEGDSAFGFSGMELETAARYKLPIVVIVFNNNGVYGADRRPSSLAAAAAKGAASGGFGSDPVPTAFIPNLRYDLTMESLGGKGFYVEKADDLEAALGAALNRAITGEGPSLINLVIDPNAGVESGNVHAFNKPTSKI